MEKALDKTSVKTSRLYKSVDNTNPKLEKALDKTSVKTSRLDKSVDNTNLPHASSAENVILDNKDGASLDKSVDSQKLLILTRLEQLEAELIENENVGLNIMKKNHNHLTKFQKSLEQCEDKIHMNGKTIIKIDSEIAEFKHSVLELHRKIEGLQLNRNQLEATNGNLETKIKEFRQSRMSLEEKVDKELCPVKESKLEINLEIQQLKERLRFIENESNSVSKQDAQGRICSC